MDEFEREVEGAVRKLTMLERAIITALPKGAAAGGRALLAEAMRRVPRRTGDLASSGFEEPVESDGSSATHRVGFKKFYALPVDRGHPVRRKRGGPIVGRAKPIPFISEPARARRNKIGREVAETIQAEVKQYL